jgi:hypothetical protein
VREQARGLAEQAVESVRRRALEQLTELRQAHEADLIGARQAAERGARRNYVGASSLLAVMAAVTIFFSGAGELLQPPSLAVTSAALPAPTHPIGLLAPSATALSERETGTHNNLPRPVHTTARPNPQPEAAPPDCTLDSSDPMDFCI